MSGKDFIGKVVIVTGSSAGIGQGTAVHFASRGASVTLCGRDQEKLTAVKQECEEVSPAESQARFHTVQGDVREEKVREQIVEETVAELGRVDVLVANAALNVGDGTVEGTTVEEYRAVMNTGVEAVFFLIQQAVPHLEKSKGNVVVVSSPAAERVSTGFLTYNISKAALDHLVRNFSIKLAGKGIRVNGIKPGAIPTSFFRYMADEATITDFLERAAAAIPIGRCGTALEVAEPIAFLASDGARYVTGSLLTVDGGITNLPIDLISH